MGARKTSTNVDKKPVVIEKLLSEVQKALEDAQSRIADPSFPKLESVILTLQTVITAAVTGKIKWLIFSFGMGWEKERSQELVLTLLPPPAARRAESFASNLADAIVEAAEGVRNAEAGTPPLSLDRLNVIVAFVVTVQGSAGATFEIQPVTLELSGNLKKKALHKVELRFKKK